MKKCSNTRRTGTSTAQEKKTRHGAETRDLAAADSDMQTEAVQALVALGYGSAESMRAVKKTSADCTTVEDILKEALKHLF